jgi:hypothetical protein
LYRAGESNGSKTSAVWIFRVDNDALDSMDEFERAVIAAPQWLRGLAPAAIEQCVRRGNARRSRRILASHDPGKNSDRGSSVAPRQRADFGEGFRHSRFSPVRFDTFARRRFGPIRDEIVHDRAERDGRKIRLLAIMLWARDKLDDFGTHEGSSHTAIAIRPTGASEIRYVVIGFSP